MSAAMTWLAQVQGMDDATWRRHSNAWSGWTRVPILPLMAWAFYQRDMLGPWLWVCVAALLFWTWVNPRAFPPPNSTTNWMSRAVLGERVWLNRAEIPVPEHYTRAIPVILTFSLTGLPLLILGLWHINYWSTVLGLGLCLLGKFWFLDRMVWLFDDMSKIHPIYKEWII